MFGSLGGLVYRRRWIVAVVVLAATVLSGIWGLGVFDRLGQGGYQDPGSESTQASDIVRQNFGQQQADVVVMYTAPHGKTVDDPAMGRAITSSLRDLPSGSVSDVKSYWDTPTPQLADREKRHGLATIALSDNDVSGKQQQFEQLRDRLKADGVRTDFAGTVPTYVTMTEKSSADLVFAETVSLPIVLVLLVLVFGSVVAAALPVLVGGLSILGALGVLHLISLGVEVNTFAVNVATLLGLGLAIDYGLFIVGRFREELGRGASTADAVRTTVSTAGRTVAFSASLLVIALASLLVFPLDFLRGLSYGGMSSVAIAAIVSVTLLPALLGVLGPRVDKLAVRKKRPAADAPLLRRLGNVVMRRPVRFAAPILIGLAVLAVPVSGIEFGPTTEKALPADNPTRQTTELVSERFPQAGNNAAQIVLRGQHGTAPSESAVARFTSAADQVSGVDGVRPVGARGDAVLLQATLAGDPVGTQAKDAVHSLRELPDPAGSEVFVGGFTAQSEDSVQAIFDKLPLMAAILAGATLVLMFLAFGSVLLPVKAVLMSLLSLGASFGVLVWIFQYGHGAEALGITPQPVEAGMLVLVGAVVFGLSTDYETFLLSRMVEARGAGQSTPDAVRTGLARTGTMISAAALLLIVVTGAFALSELSNMRFIGVGMIVALALDATVVRMMLVPAVLRLLGNASWWAPGPLRRLQRRAGLAEIEEPAERELERVG
ncbi:MAG: MMPL family transporter [Pseudonocardiaceae bacterium]|nr:MMPL family transporter [Pseudonocardiaceae bacterium]